MCYLLAPDWIMVPVLYSLGALLFWIVGISAYHFTTAYMASFFGIKVQYVAIGFGPTLFQKVCRRWTVRIGAIPLGGSTKFLVDDEDMSQDGSSTQGTISKLTPLVQILTCLSGPLAVAVLGVLCISIPVWAGSPQLEVSLPHESAVRPCGVPGLVVRDQPSSWPAQWNLLSDTAIEFSIRLVTFDSLDGWGGLIAYFVTCGSVGALSSSAWLTCVGVLLLWMGVINLIPVPPLNGFRILLATLRAITKRELAENVQTSLTIIGMLVILVFYGRIIWADLHWLWNAWF